MESATDVCREYPVSQRTLTLHPSALRSPNFFAADLVALSAGICGLGSVQHSHSFRRCPVVASIGRNATHHPRMEVGDRVHCIFPGLRLSVRRAGLHLNVAVLRAGVLCLEKKCGCAFWLLVSPRCLQVSVHDSNRSAVCYLEAKARGNRISSGRYGACAYFPRTCGSEELFSVSGLCAPDRELATP